MSQYTISAEVKTILNKLNKAGYEAYVVGGCVRDLLRGVEPQDWDVATSAKPEEIQKIFPKSFYANKFGTVTVKVSRESKELEESKETKEVEVTTYRVDEKYGDKRHPDKVEFTKSLEEDLKRRDFIINAMAIGIKLQITNSKLQINHKSQTLNSKLILIDPFGGEKDLESKVIRAVGDPEERFNEDALRMMRAVRFATTLGFAIEEKTLESIKKHAGLLNFISKERIRDEFIKIIEAQEAENGIVLLEETGLLKYIIPELEEGVDVGQNKHHIYTIWDHNLHSLGWAAKKNYPLDVRIASLFHDIGKPRTKEGEGLDSTFYGHEVVGARMSAKILDRLKFPKKITEKITTLVRYHLFYYNVNEVTERSVRRLVSKVGKENMDDLILVRIADRKGSGVPKAEPYKIRHLRYIIEKVSRDPITPKMLELKGDGLMKLLGIGPGPKVGEILAILLDEVLDDPERNTKLLLSKRVKKLGALKDSEISKLAWRARRKTEEAGEAVEERHKRKYWVK